MANRFRSTLARVSIIVVLVAAVGACSRVDVIYAVADDVLESRAERLLDMSDPADAEHLEATIDALFKDRSKTLSPQISAYLTAQADALEATDSALTRDDIARSIEDLRHLLREAAEGAAPYIAEVLVRHTTPERIAHLEAALAERHAEKVEEFADMTPDEVRADRIERTVIGVERFVPDLTDDQIAIIAEIVDAEIARGGRARWLDNIAAKDAALIAFLRTGPDQDAIAGYMVDWFTRSWTVADPAFKSHADAWWASRVDLVFAVCETMSPEQKAQTIEKLRGYAEDIAGLTS